MVTRVNKFLSSSFAPALGVFVCAAAVALLHHFAFAHPRTTFLYDARSYLSSTAHVAEFLRSVLHFRPDTSPIATKDFIAAIVNDGPVLTGFFGAIFAVSNHIPQNKDWTTFQFIQSLIHAASATLVYVAALRATGKRGAATFAGLLWATYPAAVVDSGRFYNEPLMILLLMAALVTASRRPASIPSTVLGSYFSGLVFLMKPALVAGAGLSYLCILLGTKSKKLGLLLIATGIIFAFGPWALYTKTFMGKAYFTTPRNSTYNFAMGNDTEVDGVLTSPMPPLTTIFCNDPQPVYFMYSQWVNNTGAYFTMLMRKTTRMYSHPWNDFRHTYFGLTAEQQRYWHLFLLFAGGFGVVFFLGQLLKANKLDYDKNSVQILALGWLAAPAIYLLFEANSRYGFSITPFLAVFSALPFARYQELYKKHRDKIAVLPQDERLLIASSVIAFLTTALIANLDSISHAGQSKELTFTMAPHEVAVKTLTLSPTMRNTAPGTRAFIIVDGDVRLERAKVTLNGHEIPGDLKHLRYYYPSKYSEYYVFQELGYSMDELPEDYRQWRMIEIPTELLDKIVWQGDNKIEVRAPDSGMTLYGESDGLSKHYLSPLFYSPIKLGNASRGLETRVVMPETKAAPAQLSQRRDGANQTTDLPGGLRVHLVLADRLPDEPSKKASAENTNPDPDQSAWAARGKHFDITNKNFDGCFSTGQPSELHTSRHVVEQAASVCADFSIPRTAGSNAVKLKLTGMVKANKKNSKVGLLLVSKNKFGQPVLISNTPPYLAAGPEWQPFSIEDILPQGELEDGPNVNLTIGIYPGPWEEICGYSCDRHSADAIIKDMKLDITPTYQLDLTKYRLILL